MFLEVKTETHAFLTHIDHIVDVLPNEETGNAILVIDTYEIQKRPSYDQKVYDVVSTILNYEKLRNELVFHKKVIITKC